MSVRIYAVEPGSIAEEMDVETGSRLLRINGKEISDALDYLFLSSAENLEVEVEDPSGEVILFDVEKEIDEDLGFVFDQGLMDEARHCSNACVFCFIDQLPKGLRKPLYFKDDDSRLSFLQGNFVTLTNMKQEQLQRIVDYGIHPINVSVHSLDPKVRRRLMKNPKSEKIREQLDFLVSSGVALCGQIVLVPGYNDGEDLVKTVEGLYAYGENFRSVAIVPLGLSGHREGLCPLRPLTREDAQRTIDLIEPLQKKFLMERGTSFAFLADEIYLLASRPLPGHAHYEGYAYAEDGIGMLRQLLHEFSEHVHALPADACGDYVIPVSTLAAPYLRRIASEIEARSRVRLRIVPIENRFFGGGVSVSGLLTFADIQEQLPPRKERTLILSRAMYNGEGRTLDEKSREDFTSLYGQVEIIEPQAAALIDLLKEKRCLDPS